MKTLIIVRHAQARLSGFKKDFTRNLTTAGIQLADQTASSIRELTHGNILIVSSDAVRAFHTARLIAHKLNIEDDDIITEHFIYHTSGIELLSYVRSLNDSFDTVILVGHNPALTELAALLSHSFSHSLNPADAAVFKLNTQSWQSVDAVSSMQLISPGSISS